MLDFVLSASAGPSAPAPTGKFFLFGFCSIDFTLIVQMSITDLINHLDQLNLNITTLATNVAAQQETLQRLTENLSEANLRRHQAHFPATMRSLPTSEVGSSLTGQSPPELSCVSFAEDSKVNDGRSEASLPHRPVRHHGGEHADRGHWALCG